MQIMINIDDRVYGLLKYFEKGLGLNDKKDNNDNVKTALMRAVINGTPLPKGHGTLIDSDKLIDKWGKATVRGRTEFDQVIMCEPTVIPAESEG